MTDFQMGRLVQGWPLIHIKELNACQEKEFAPALVGWPSCSCCDRAKGDPGSPARLALTQASGESASGCWVIARWEHFCPLVGTSTLCVERRLDRHHMGKQEGWPGVFQSYFWWSEPEQGRPPVESIQGHCGCWFLSSVFFAGLILRIPLYSD